MRASLRAKVIFLLAVVVVIVLAVLFFQIISKEKQILETAFEEKAMILAMGLDAGISSREQLSDISKLQADIYKFIWLYSEIIEISMSVPGSEGLEVIASNNTEEIGNLTQEEGTVAYNEGKFLTETLVLSSGERVFSAIAPIHVGGQIAGIYNIKISLKTEEDIISGQQKYVAGAILVSVIILITILYLLLSVMVIIPISKIKNGLSMIADGDFSKRFDSRSKDEIGDLAKGLNEMTEKLENFYDELEKKVKEKTKELEKAKGVLEIKVKERTKELEELIKNQEKIIKERTEEAENKVNELERFNKLIVGRELRMVELKDKMEELKKEVDKLKKS